MKQFLELQQMKMLHKYIGETDLVKIGSLYIPYETPYIPINNDGTRVTLNSINDGVMYTAVPRNERELHNGNWEVLRYSLADVISLLPEGLSIYVKHKSLNDTEYDLYEVSYCGFTCINPELIDALYDLFILLNQKQVL